MYLYWVCPEFTPRSDFIQIYLCHLNIAKVLLLVSLADIEMCVHEFNVSRPSQKKDNKAKTVDKMLMRRQGESLGYIAVKSLNQTPACLCIEVSINTQLIF